MAVRDLELLHKSFDIMPLTHDPVNAPVFEGLDNVGHH
jgi:hypothetical protein